MWNKKTWKCLLKTLYRVYWIEQTLKGSLDNALQLWVYHVFVVWKCLAGQFIHCQRLAKNSMWKLWTMAYVVLCFTNSYIWVYVDSCLVWVVHWKHQVGLAIYTCLTLLASHLGRVQDSTSWLCSEPRYIQYIHYNYLCYLSWLDYWEFWDNINLTVCLWQC